MIENLIIMVILLILVNLLVNLVHEFIFGLFRNSS